MRILTRANHLDASFESYFLAFSVKSRTISANLVKKKMNFHQETIFLSKDRNKTMPFNFETLQ